MNDKGEPCIGDFGISRKSGLDMTYGIGTGFYMAPELYDDSYDCMVDVYSYALLIYHMFSPSIIDRLLGGRVIMDDNRVVRPDRYITRVYNKARLRRSDITEPIPEALWSLITICWEHNPKDRLPFKAIVKELMNSNDWVLEGTNMAELKEYQHRIIQGVDLDPEEEADDFGDLLVEIATSRNDDDLMQYHCSGRFK